MPGKKRYASRTRFSKILLKKIPNDLHLKTVEFTLSALRWVFLLIFLFIAVGIIMLFITGGESYIQTIVGYSITGFFTFFMGYFGWILAQSIIEMMLGEEKKDSQYMSYYLSNRNKRRKNYYITGKTKLKT